MSWIKDFKLKSDNNKLFISTTKYSRNLTIFDDASCFHSLDRWNLKSKLRVGLKFVFNAFFYSEISLESLFMIKSLNTLVL
jgi:hypothetical protein